tara:strand:+ start:27646 stop:29802 length:2157 start_codon:yes stop_codon:yes gene_type:complete
MTTPPKVAAAVLAGIKAGFIGPDAVADGYVNEDYINATSFPGIPLNVLEIPKPKGFSAEWFYNKHTEDECENDSGLFDGTPKSLALQEALGLSGGDTVLDFSGYLIPENGEPIINLVDFLSFVPRFVLFNFGTPAQDLSIDFLPMPNEPAQITVESMEALIRANFDTLVDESYFSKLGYSGVPYTSFALQDNNAAQELIELAVMGGEIKYLLGEAGDPKTGLEDLVADLKTSDKEHTLANDELETTAAFVDNATNAAMSNPNVKIWDPENGDYLAEEETFSRVVHYGQLNGKFAHQIANRMSSKPSGPFSNVICDDLQFLSQFQTNARAFFNPEQMNLAEYDLQIPLIQDLLEDKYKTQVIGQLPPGTPLEWKFQAAGYLIEKFELVELLSQDGALVGTAWQRRDTVVFGSPYHLQGIDAKIKVGAIYLYRPRTLALIDAPIYDVVSGGLYLQRILVMSKPGYAMIVDCSKPSKFDPPPQAPRDLKFVWDYYRDELTFHWGFPPERQGDVAYFKVYRRKTLAEPFQLLAFYDFSPMGWCGSQKIPVTAWIRPSLIKKMKFPQTFYVDTEFDMDSTYIYAVVAGDLFGSFSNYSAQYVVSFDRFTNKLKVELMSPIDAPEPYPNWFVRENVSTLPGVTNLTTDLISVSNYDQMFVGFDPDCMDVTVDGESLQHVVYQEIEEDAQTESDAFGRYIMQITNVDRHQTQALELYVRKFDSIT